MDADWLVDNTRANGNRLASASVLVEPTLLSECRVSALSPMKLGIKAKEKKVTKDRKQIDSCSSGNWVFFCFHALENRKLVHVGNPCWFDNIPAVSSFYSHDNRNNWVFFFNSFYSLFFCFFF